MQSGFQTSTEYKNYSVLTNHPNTNTNTIRFWKITRIRIWILFGLNYLNTIRYRIIRSPLIHMSCSNLSRWYSVWPAFNEMIQSNDTTIQWNDTAAVALSYLSKRNPWMSTADDPESKTKTGEKPIKTTQERFYKNPGHSNGKNWQICLFFLHNSRAPLDQLTIRRLVNCRDSFLGP